MKELRALKFKPHQKNKLREQLRANYDESTQALGDWPQRHDRRFRRYRSDVTLRPQGPYPESPRTFTSHTRRNFEKILGELWTAIMGNNDAVKVEGWRDEDLSKQKRATNFLRWALTKAINDSDLGGWDYISYMSLFDALMDGVGILKVYRWSTPWNAPEGDDGRWLKDIIRVDNIDQGYLLIPPGVKNLQYPDCPYVHERLFLTWDQLRRKEKEGWSVPKDQEEIPEKEKPLNEQQKNSQEKDGFRQSRRVDTYEVVESYERFPLDGYEEDIVVHWYPDAKEDDKNWMARAVYMEDIFPARDRPRRPYFPIALWLQPRELRGLNVPDRMETPQDILNRLHEQFVSYGEISMLPFFFVNAMVTGDIPDLRQIKPGQGVPVNSLDGVQFAPRQSLNNHFLQQIQTQGSEIEADMGVSDFALGRAPDRPNAPRTKGGTAMVLQQGQKMWGVLVHHVKNQMEAPLQFYFELWQEYIQPGLKAKIGDTKRLFPLANQPESQGMLGPESMVSMPEVTGDGPQNLAERVLGPAKNDDGQIVAETITKDQLSGIFDVKVTVNPNADYDKQLMTTFTEYLTPILQQVYPLGLQRMLSRVWELYNLQGFDRIFPENIAMIWQQVVAEQTQVNLLELKLKETQIKMALAQTSQSQEPSPEQQQMMQAQQALQQAVLSQQAETIQMQSAIEHAQAQSEVFKSQEEIKQQHEKSQQSQIKTAQEGQKLASQLQQAEIDKKAAERDLERKDEAQKAKETQSKLGTGGK